MKNVGIIYETPHTFHCNTQKINNRKMKFTTIYLEENKIEIFNSITGIETIKVNGEEVSSKFSITGAEHHFQISEDGINSNCRIVIGLGVNGAVIDFYKNEKPIIESPKSGCLVFLLIVIGLSFLLNMTEFFF